MVIGSGLISKSFDVYSNDDNVVVFASGVSNSREMDDNSYYREYKLIESYKLTKSKFVYFSSININDINSKYFSHKINIENYISDNFEKYLIFRLPQVVGFGGNSNNLFNFLKNKIEKGESLVVEDVHRSLIDIDDISSICKYCIMNNSNEIINISYIENLKVIDIISLISDKLSTKVDIEFSNKIDNIIDLKNSEVVDYIIDSLYNINREEYTKRLIDKYI